MAAEHRRTVLDGGDPIEHGRQEKADREAKAAIPTFREVAERVIELRRPTWSNDRHARQWTESLTNHVFPVIGDKRMDEVTTADALAVLTPIWMEIPETSTRVKQRMAKMFDYAIANGWRPDNPANGVLDAALPRKARLKEHHPAPALRRGAPCPGRRPGIDGGSGNASVLRVPGAHGGAGW